MRNKIAYFLQDHEGLSLLIALPLLVPALPFVLFMVISTPVIKNTHLKDKKGRLKTCMLCKNPIHKYIDYRGNLKRLKRKNNETK